MVAARERELLRAAGEVFDERGYERLTVDEVAARARASKATIYRRWPSKPALVAAAIAARVERDPFVEPSLGLPLRDALLQLVGALAGEAVALRSTVAGLIAEARRHDELGQALQGGFVERRRAAMEAVLREHAAEIEDGVDAEMVAALAPATIYFRVLITDEPVDDDLARALVDDIMLPLLSARRGR